jgi:2-dehydrotetronate isomerase
MPQFAANLSMLYPELSFVDRFAAAASDGFKGVEFLFPYAFEAPLLARALHDNGLKQVLFNAPPGDWDAGERGTACLAGRELEFQAGITSGLRYAQVLDCPRIHVMAGLIPDGESAQTVRSKYVANLRWAAQQAAQQGVSVMIEPINTRDMSRYFLNHQADAHALLHEIGEPNVHVQFDLYHAQIMGGDLASTLRQYLPTGRVGHIQIAGVPQRHEPDVGEINYSYLFELIDQLGWQGWIGCEYRPAGGAAAGATRAGLGWLKPYLYL